MQRLVLGRCVLRARLPGCRHQRHRPSKRPQAPAIPHRAATPTAVVPLPQQASTAKQQKKKQRCITHTTPKKTRGCPTKIDTGVSMYYTSTGLEDHPPRGSRPHTGSPPQTQVPRGANPCRNIERVQMGSGVSVTINACGRPIPDIGRYAGGSASLDGACECPGAESNVSHGPLSLTPDPIQCEFATARHTSVHKTSNHTTAVITDGSIAFVSSFTHCVPPGPPEYTTKVARAPVGHPP